MECDKRVPYSSNIGYYCPELERIVPKKISKESPCWNCGVPLRTCSRCGNNFKGMTCRACGFSLLNGELMKIINQERCTHQSGMIGCQNRKGGCLLIKGEGCNDFEAQE
jgi:hypothetical protein